MEPADLRATSLEPATGRLLVAAPVLADPNFAHTIVLLLDVDPPDGTDGEDGGVLGVVLNRPSEVSVADVLEGWTPAVGSPAVLFEGGPVSPDSALAVARVARPTADPLGWRPLFGSTGLVDLDAPADVVRPALTAMRIYAGYAGWSRAQLGDEIAEGAWYVVDSEPGDVFAGEPHQLWRTVLGRQRGELAWLATYPVDPTQN